MKRTLLLLLVVPLLARASDKVCYNVHVAERALDEFGLANYKVQPLKLWPARLCYVFFDSPEPYSSAEFSLLFKGALKPIVSWMLKLNDKETKRLTSTDAAGDHTMVFDVVSTNYSESKHTGLSQSIMVAIRSGQIAWLTARVFNLDKGRTWDADIHFDAQGNFTDDYATTSDQGLGLDPTGEFPVISDGPVTKPSKQTPTTKTNTNPDAGSTNSLN